jgi:DNA-binding transcriptional LysR family regulator
MVRSGIGLGFFSFLYVADDLASGALVALTVDDLKPLYRESALVWFPRETPLSAAAKAFVTCLHDQAVRLNVARLRAGDSEKRRAFTSINRR